MADNAVRKVGGTLVRLSRAVNRIRSAAQPESLREAPSNVLTMSARLNEPKIAPSSGDLTPCLLQQAIDKGMRALSNQQKPDGHFVFELEADSTIPAEYVLLVHWLGEAPDLELERRIGVYLRRVQGEHGGWPLFEGGRLNISASVKAYFALKMIGDDPDAPHMVRARQAILAHAFLMRVE